MREANVEVKVEGILNEVNLRDLTYKNRNTGQDTNAVAGEIYIKVNQEINGEMKTLIVPVQVFANQFKKDGTPSTLYTNMKEVQAGKWKSVAVTGDEETADRIRCDRARIQMHSYVNQAGKLVTIPRVSGNLFQIIPKATCVEQATFQAEFVVRQAQMETNADGIETGRYKIIGVIPGWGNKVEVVPFFAINEGVINVVSSYWNIGNSVKATGRLLFTSEVQEVEVPVDFGEPLKETRTIRVSDFIITGGSQTPLDGELAFPTDEINAAVAVWKKGQDDLLAVGPKQPKQTQTTTQQNDTSFGDYGF